MWHSSLNSDLQNKFLNRKKNSIVIIYRLPFIIGQAIRLAVEDKIRYGGKIILTNDGVTQIHQLIFKEMLGLPVGASFI